MSELDKDKLIRQVKERGYEIKTIDDLMRMDESNKDLIPVLLEHLAEVTDEVDKEFLVRWLTVKGYTEVTAALIQEFYSAKNPHYKWAIGNALSVIEDKSAYPELLKIVQDPKHGIGRQMIVYGLWKHNCDETKQVLISLLNDEDVLSHAIYALSRMRDPSLIPYLEPFLTYQVTWIRNEAKKGVARLTKLAQKSKETG